MRNRFVKRKSLSLVLAAAFCVGMLSGCAKGTETTNSAGSENATNAVEKTSYKAVGQYNGLDIAAQNDQYALLYNKNTAVVSILNKQSGTIWSSSATEEELSGISVDQTRNEMLSSAILKYYDSSDNSFTLNTYGDCVSKSQQTVYSIQNGIRIEYVIGEAESVDIYPKALTADYVESQILPKLDESQKKRFLQYFTKYVYSQTSENIRNELSQTYTNFPTTALYNAETVPVKYRRVIKEALESCGLNEDILQEEYDKLGYSCTLTPQASFSMAIEYTLDHDHLNVRVPCNDVSYNKNVFYITEIQVLPFFGACSEQNDGYMLIPDGSGALVNLNNTNKNATSVTVYSEDVNQDYENVSSIISENTNLPGYGLKQGNHAFLAVLQDGASLATIKAVPYNNLTGLNHIYASYDYLERQTFKPNGLVRGTEFVRYGSQSYQDDIVQSYYFLEGEHSTYADMAALYRNYLFGSSERSNVTGRLYLESYGVINCKNTVLGFKVQQETPYTTVSQLGDMLQTLYDNHVGNVVVRYRNWANDPLISPIDTKGKVNSRLGNKQDLKALTEIQENVGAKILWDWETMYSVRLPLLGSLSRKSNAVYSIQNVFVKEYYSKDDEDSGRYILNAGGLSTRLAQIASLSGKNNWTGVSLNNIGSDLYSDFSKSNYTLREDMIKTLVDGIKEFPDEDTVAISGANSYLLPYADVVFDIPMDCSQYSSEDETVPFLQMVLHGYVPYTGSSVNLAYDYQQGFLKSVEYGAALQFTLNAGDSTILKNSQYSRLFSTNFSLNLNDLLSMDQQYQDQLAWLENAAMVGHKALTRQVMQTTYDNGAVVLVNYGTDAYSTGNATVEGQSFLVLKDGENAG